MLNWLKKFISPSETAVNKSPERPLDIAMVSPMVTENSSENFRKRGNEYLRRGNLASAEACYRHAISLDPNNADLNINLGFVLKESKRLDDAVPYLKQATVLKPESMDAFYVLGNVLQEQDKFSEAAQAYAEALNLNPHFEDLYRDLCYALFQAGKIKEAMQIIRQGLNLYPESADFHYYLGNLYSYNKEHDQAISCYHKALSIRPGYVEVLCNLGKELLGKNDLEAAIASYRKALKFDSNNFEACFYLANALKESLYHNEAIAAYRQALQLKPDCAEAFNNLGNIYLEQGNKAEARTCFEKAVAIAPDFAESYHNLGSVFHEKGQLNEAQACYERALALSPASAESHHNLASVLRYKGELEEALVYERKALELNPDFHIARYHLVHLLQHMCDWEAQEADIDLVRKNVRENLADSWISPFTFFSLPGTTAAEQRLCAEQWAQREYKLMDRARDRLAFNFDRQPSGKIRIGYLSADFHQHATALLMAEVFELHDRERFHIAAYSYGPNDRSSMRRRLESAFDDFVEIGDMSNEDAAKKIYEDKIDILVDLKGHTQNTRSAILALRPAPIQVNYLGYPGTMGANFVDYIVADKFIIPPELQKHYVEKVIYVQDCYQPNDRTRPRSPAPSRTECGLPESATVLCCFNHTYKITADIFAIWCRLLKAVPDSVLWLLASNKPAEANLRRAAQKHGIAGDRIIMAPHKSPAEHLARIQCADLFLDTLPVNAHTTCSDALWMGVPVVTCAGESFPSRVAGSLLTAMYVPELITYNLDDYYALALDLSMDRQRLTGLRRKIIANRDLAPLFDSKLFTLNLEAAYAEMWERHRASR